MKSSPDSLKSIPLGTRIPDSPHAVSVSLPKIGDVVAYEEKEPATMAKVCSGYPRFVKHPYIVEFGEAYRRQVGLAENRNPIFFSSHSVVEDAMRLHPDLRFKLDEFQGIPCAIVDGKSPEELALSKYIQHTGTGLSSREAEDLMIGLGSTRTRFPESKTLVGGNDRMRYLLQQWFEPSVSSTILPCKSGMNAFYTAFRAINQIQSPRNRRDWISVGWLYLDTLQILNQFLEPGGKTHHFLRPADTQEILDFIREKADTVAGLILEAPTNPLVHTPDIEAIGTACREAGIATVMDPSLVSPRNVDLSPWCDAICCSLTKYAAYEGDVMIGALSINQTTPLGIELDQRVPQLLTPPYPRDFARLGGSLEDATSILKGINRNTMELADYFLSKPAKTRVHWAYSQPYAENYQRVQRSPECPGGVITLELKTPLERFYDALPLAKGPSFGTEFTLVCAYIHLAHYDLLKTAEGRGQLASAGIHPDMVRLSIGQEDPEELKAIFEEALKE